VDELLPLLLDSVELNFRRIAAVMFNAQLVSCDKQSSGL
jgi:hypothetical protein